MLLLDTNVVSELRKVRDGRTDPNFTAWSKSLRWADLFLSVMTIYELEVGVSRLESYDAAQGSVLRTWFREKVLTGFTLAFSPSTMRSRSAAQSFSSPAPGR
jgi:toxin FitB